LIPLAEAGYEVWGVDSSPAMLAKAREKILLLPEEVRARIHLVEADMRNFQLKRGFRLVLIPANSFLHLSTPHEQLNALRNIASHLAQGGVLVVDVFAPRHDLLAQEKRQSDQKIVDPSSGHVILRNDRVTNDRVNQLIHVDSILDEYDDAGRFIRRTLKPIELCYIFRREMEYLLKLAGFKVEEVYGGYDKNPYDYVSGKMIFVASVPSIDQPV
jgi:SAM-dependent methyltransferase